MTDTVDEVAAFPPEPEHHEAAFTSYRVLLDPLIRPGMRIVEIGCGEYSTDAFLASEPKILVSIESDMSWYKRIFEKHGVRPDWCPVYSLGLIEAGFIPETIPFDLALVDGCQNGRVPAIEKLQGMGVPLLVVHDWDGQEHYGYDATVPHSGYSVDVDRSMAAHTALFRLGESHV